MKKHILLPYLFFLNVLYSQQSQKPTYFYHYKINPDKTVTIYRMINNREKIIFSITPHGDIIGLEDTEKFSYKGSQEEYQKWYSRALERQ